MSSREQTRELILLVSNDKGLSWREVARNLATEPSFHFQAPEEGEYWFIVQQVDEQGRRKPANRIEAKPSIRVCVVDTTAPRAQLFQPEINQKAVDLGWEASDANLVDNPITLEWAEQKDGPWYLIGEDHLPNTGHYKWHLNNEIPSRVYLRIRVRDKAGNEACAATDKPERIK
jgi:hypothetical protein